MTKTNYNHGLSETKRPGHLVTGPPALEGDCTSAAFNVPRNQLVASASGGWLWLLLGGQASGLVGVVKAIYNG